MKNIILTLILGSFLFSGINFNQSTAFSDLDEDNGPLVMRAVGVDFDLNDTMSLGYDSMLGMMVKADGPSGLVFRIAFNDAFATYGVQYDWWNGGDGIKTSLSTSVDYSTMGGGEDETSIRINLGWGF